MSFSPNPGVVGAQVAIAITSARGNPDVVLQVWVGGASVNVQGPTVETGVGKGYIWRWTMTPAQAGQYDATFYVGSSILCTTNNVQVNASAAATNTPTSTAPPTATHTVGPSVTPTATRTVAPSATPTVTPTVALPPPSTKTPTPTKTPVPTSVPTKASTSS